MKNKLQNDGLIWTKGQYLKLQMCKDEHHLSWKETASIMGRSVNACIVRYRMFRIVELLNTGMLSDTLRTMKEGKVGGTGRR